MILFPISVKTWTRCNYSNFYR